MNDKTITTLTALTIAAALSVLSLPGYPEFIGLAKVIVPALLAANLGEVVTTKYAEFRIAKMRGDAP